MVKKPVKRRAPAQKRSEFTVNAILQAAGDLLVEAGYAKMTTNAVAERAGVSIGTLYQYFSNKDALVAALRQDHEDRVQKALRSAATDNSFERCDQMMVQMIRANVHVHLINPRLHRVLLIDTPTAVDASKHAVCRFNADANEVFQITERRCQAFLPELDVETQVRPMLVGIWRMAETLTHTLVVDCPTPMEAPELEKVIMTSCSAYAETIVPQKYQDGLI